MENDIKPGDKIRYLKGAVIHSTGKPNERVARRAQEVYVHHMFGGTHTTRAVAWAGRGGYWCWTDIKNVTKVTE